MRDLLLCLAQVDLYIGGAVRAPHVAALATHGGRWSFQNVSLRFV